MSFFSELDVCSICWEPFHDRESVVYLHGRAEFCYAHDEHFEKWPGTVIDILGPSDERLIGVILPDKSDDMREGPVGFLVCSKTCEKRARKVIEETDLLSAIGDY